jgi:FkbM family methyltransferase
MTILSYLQQLQQSTNPKSVLDIGANVGEFSHLCKSLWNDIDILMVEGNENCEPDLKLTGYPYTIELLGDEEKEVDFYIQSDNIKGTGCSYYREITHLYDEPIIVKKTLKKLDNIVNQTFDIIKIDTQGSELDIIRGGKNTISKASYVILELPIKEYNLNSPKIEEIIEEMKSLGFDDFSPIEEHRWPNHDNLFEYNELFQIDAVFTKKSMKKTNIIDCFPYFNEKELLELRINLLNDYVDYFIIMEGDRTHSGAPKEFTCMKDLETLNINTDKVIVLQVELPEGEDIHNQIDVKNIALNELEKGVEENKKYLSHWARERIQRDALLNLVDDCDDNTVFFITDCDEIVDPKNIEYIAKVVRNTPEVVIKIPLVFLEGSANCRVYYKNGNPVECNISTFACLKSHLKKATPTELRCNISDYELRGITENGKYLPDLGWHFGWMGDIERRKTKCESFLHANTFNTEENVNNITSYIPQEGSISISDYKNCILKKYPNSLLPQKIFELPRVKAFLIPDETPAFTFHSNPRPALWVVDNFYDDPYAVRDFALKQEYLQGGLGKGFIGKRSCKQFLFPGLRETFQKITGIPITRWEEHGMNGRFQSTIAGEPNVYHSDEQTWAGAIYLTPDAPYNAGTSLIAHKSTRIRHSSHPEAYKMWSDPNTYDIHLDPSPWERIDVAANVFNRLVIWNAHCPHAAGEYFGDTLDTSRLIHLFFFD